MTSFGEFFNALDEESLIAYNKAALAESARNYQEFENSFKKGVCCYCNGTLNTINEKTGSCYHWLLAPKSLKKKNIERFFLEHDDYLALTTYLKWVANTDRPFAKINNLADEKNPAKLIEETIVYKTIEWSFSCGKTDFEGHADSKNANFPHYHFSMVIDGRPFISFNDLHIRLNSKDVYVLKAKFEHPDKVDTTSYFGQGMQELLTTIPSERLLDTMSTTDDFDNSTFRVQSMILSKPGESISGDELIRLLNQSKETGIPVAKLIKDSNNFNVQTFITPGDGVPEIKKRSPRKKKGN